MTGFAIVDVFAQRPLTGNPLAVVPDADGLDVPAMRAIAREFNQSETTFLFAPDRSGVDWWLRSFTAAGVEVSGAGHNALGAWLWLALAGRLGSEPRQHRTQLIAGEVLDVEVRQPSGGPVEVVLDHSAPTFGAVVAQRAPVATVLGLTEQDLDPTLPVQVVSTGAGHLLVPVRDRATVDRIAVDPRALLPVLAGAGGEGCYIYTVEPGPDSADITDDAGADPAADAYARFVNPTVGIDEDPATGTAAGPLAALLVRDGRTTSGATILQGAAMGRPSVLRVDVDGDRVRLRGSGLVVAEGRLLL